MSSWVIALRLPRNPESSVLSRKEARSLVPLRSSGRDGSAGWLVCFASSANKIAGARVVRRAELNERITLDINRILQVLPHRFPFVMVDRVTNVVPHES